MRPRALRPLSAAEYQRMVVQDADEPYVQRRGGRIIITYGGQRIQIDLDVARRLADKILEHTA